MQLAQCPLSQGSQGHQQIWMSPSLEVDLSTMLCDLVIRRSQQCNIICDLSDDAKVT